MLFISGILVNTDRGEMRNLAVQMPDKAGELARRWQQQLDECIRLSAITNRPTQ